jgi:hypothetical protein
MTRPVRVGDAIAAATSAVGVRPCGGCKRRQDMLNRAFAPSQVSPGHGRRRKERHRAPVQFAVSLLVGVCAMTLRKRLRNQSRLRERAVTGAK